MTASEDYFSTTLSVSHLDIHTNKSFLIKLTLIELSSLSLQAKLHK